MNDSRTAGLKRLIAMICMVVACLSPIRAISASSADLDHVFDLAHALAAGDDIVHYCEMSSAACESPAHEGDARTAPHHHHGDPSSGFMVISGEAFSLSLTMSGANWPVRGFSVQGLGPTALERPPRA
ncbi:hypothetical protein [Xanthobacter versatilis]|uniref:hypothetical protein n=1 Tax=Xanthobacter autotrophicus (strain ATCC BAA-1158 / Py2) TaxID=78245 RepID=UPI003727EDD3